MENPHLVFGLIDQKYQNIRIISFIGNKNHIEIEFQLEKDHKTETNTILSDSKGTNYIRKVISPQKRKCLQKFAIYIVSFEENPDFLDLCFLNRFAFQANLYVFRVFKNYQLSSELRSYNYSENYIMGFYTRILFGKYLQQKFFIMSHIDLGSKISSFFEKIGIKNSSIDIKIIENYLQSREEKMKEIDNDIDDDSCIFLIFNDYLRCIKIDKIKKLFNQYTEQFNPLFYNIINSKKKELEIKINIIHEFLDSIKDNGYGYFFYNMFMCVKINPQDSLNTVNHILNTLFKSCIRHMENEQHFVKKPNKGINGKSYFYSDLDNEVVFNNIMNDIFQNSFRYVKSNTDQNRLTIRLEKKTGFSLNGYELYYQGQCLKNQEIEIVVELRVLYYRIVTLYPVHHHEQNN